MVGLGSEIIDKHRKQTNKLLKERLFCLSVRFVCQSCAVVYTRRGRVGEGEVWAINNNKSRSIKSLRNSDIWFNFEWIGLWLPATSVWPTPSGPLFCAFSKVYGRSIGMVTFIIRFYQVNHWDYVSYVFDLEGELGEITFVKFYGKVFNRKGCFCWEVHWLKSFHWKSV